MRCPHCGEAAPTEVDALKALVSAASNATDLDVKVSYAALARGAAERIGTDAARSVSALDAIEAELVRATEVRRAVG